MARNGAEAQKSVESAMRRRKKERQMLHPNGGEIVHG